VNKNYGSSEKGGRRRSRGGNQPRHGHWEKKEKRHISKKGKGCMERGGGDIRGGGVRLNRTPHRIIHI